MKLVINRLVCAVSFAIVLSACTPQEASQGKLNHQKTNKIVRSSDAQSLADALADNEFVEDKKSSQNSYDTFMKRHEIIDGHTLGVQKPQKDHPHQNPGQHPGDQHRDFILYWNAIGLDLNAADHALPEPDQAGPVRTSRALAILHVAMFDAYNVLRAKRYSSYLVDEGPQGASLEAAVSMAAYTTLIHLYPSHSKAIGDAFYSVQHEFSGTHLSKRIGYRFGEDVGDQILALRSGDGANASVPYNPSGEPGQHIVDPINPDQGYLDPQWGDVVPFVMQSPEQIFSTPPFPELNSEAYTADFEWLRSLGGDGIVTPSIRTAEQLEIGIFWAYDGRPGLGTPQRLYNQAARTIARKQGNTEYENARLFALVNLAMADAGIKSWFDKYANETWRPIVAIRNADLDGNPETIADPDWKPYGAPLSNEIGENFTPNFPSYTSGHATFGAAVFRTLANFYGTDSISFTLKSDEFNGVTTDNRGMVRPVRTRSFSSFSEAAEENGISRVFLGIHWTFDSTHGITSGNAVADYVFQNVLVER